MITNIPLVLDTVRGFVQAVQSNVTRPVYYWQKLPNGQIHVDISSANPPSSVTLWNATTIDGNRRRDFRLVALMNDTSPPGKPFLHPVFWAHSPMSPSSSNATFISYDALLPSPEVGWVGFVVELVFPGVNGTNFRVSSAPSILPNDFPYEDCYGESCQGPLV